MVGQSCRQPKAHDLCVEKWPLRTGSAKKASEKVRINTQPPNFARILGRAPQTRSVRAQFVEPAMLEAFGPGERINRPKSSLVCWNFVREDDKQGFTLFARIRPKAKRVTINLVAEFSSASFYTWVLDRLGAVENGDAAPLFLGSGAFAITRAR